MVHSPLQHLHAHSADLQGHAMPAGQPHAPSVLPQGHSLVEHAAPVAAEADAACASQMQVSSVQQPPSVLQAHVSAQVQPPSPVQQPLVHLQFAQTMMLSVSGG